MNRQNSSIRKDQDKDRENRIFNADNAELKVLSNLMIVNEKAMDKRNQLKWKTK